MLTIISGSNRDDNTTKKVALEYQRFLKEKNIPSRIFSLDVINSTIRNESFIKAEQEMLLPAQKFIIIMPEYNGSYPGILKLMIDNTDIKKAWANKKVLLTGVSTGRAGNLRGMDHLTGVLLHMQMLVHPNRLPISVVNTLLDEHFQFTDSGTLKAIHTQLDEFINF